MARFTVSYFVAEYKKRLMGEIKDISARYGGLYDGFESSIVPRLNEAKWY